MIIRENTELNCTNFDSFLENKVVLVDFWAEWCQPCKIQHQMLDELALEMDHVISFAKVNVDENKVIANRLGVRNLPSLILFKNGVEIRRIIGLQQKTLLKSVITKFLSSTEHQERNQI